MVHYLSFVSSYPADPRWDTVDHEYESETSWTLAKSFPVVYDDGSYYIDLKFGSPVTQQRFLVDTTTSLIRINTRNVGKTPGMSQKVSETFKYHIKPSSLHEKEVTFPGIDIVFGSDKIKIDNFAHRVEFKVIDSLDTTPHVLGLGISDIYDSSKDSRFSVDKKNLEYSSFIELLKNEGYISYKLFSLWLAGAGNSPNSALLFGAIDTQKFYGALQVVPMVDYYSETFGGNAKTMGIKLSEILQIDTFQITINQPVLLDSRKLMSLLPTEVVDDFVTSIGAEKEHEGAYWIDCERGSTILYFGFSGSHVAINLSSLLMPEKKGKMCRLAVMKQFSPPYSLGNTILKAMYIVFDLEKNEIGISQANDQPDFLMPQNLVPVCDGIPNAVSAPKYSIPSVKGLSVI